MTEETTTLRKSKPVMLGAGIIWVVIGYAAPEYGVTHEQLKAAISHDLGEYSSLFLFLFAAMTYIAALERGNVFAALRAWLVSKGLSYRQLFWVTGVIAFFLSAIADNLTTALVMGAVILALGAENTKFVALGMVNVVSAANAGGAFSPFGDITTLMVWQSGRIEFFEFFVLFMPSVATFIVPASIISLYVPAGTPFAHEEKVTMVRGAKRGIALGILTIAMAVSFEQFLGLPPFMGMMTGLSLLMFQSYYLRMTSREGDPEYNVFNSIKLVEWDTLLFFFGVIFSVGGLAFIGYLELASNTMYGNWGPTTANIVMGAASAIIDNIPVMFSILSMGPEMNHFQWLLVTLTCGVGGTLLSVGSAAGVALMGTSKGQYTFLSHLRWTPVLALGYASGIAVHFLVNG
jgi:Na+/H+ antiporter NhaD/arsenite permease-like protein